MLKRGSFLQVFLYLNNYLKLVDAVVMGTGRCVMAHAGYKASWRLLLVNTVKRMLLSDFFKQ